MRITESYSYGIPISRSQITSLHLIRSQVLHAFAECIHITHLPVTEIRFSSLGGMSHKNILGYWTGH